MDSNIHTHMATWHNARHFDGTVTPGVRLLFGATANNTHAWEFTRVMTLAAAEDLIKQLRVAIVDAQKGVVEPK